MSSGYHGGFESSFEELVAAPRARHARRHPLRLVTALLVCLLLIGACI
jgi:hypothetical protein